MDKKEIPISILSVQHEDAPDAEGLGRLASLGNVVPALVILNVEQGENMKMKRHACAVIFIACLWVASALAGTSPVLESVTLSTNNLQNGGSITVTVIAVSDSPVNWINRSLYGPNGNIYGGGGSWPPWTDLGNNRWQCQWIDEISSWAPSGEYVYRYISVENEAQLESGVWPDISFTVANDAEPSAPVLESVSLSTNNLQNGGSITVTVIAVSESPVDWINRSLDGPNGNIYGGGGSWPPWTDLGNNRWQCQRIDEISSWAPSGEYVYRYISVENEAQLESGVWPDLSFSARNRIIESISTEGHSVSITFPTESGRTFLVQRSPSFNPPEWVTVETIIGTGTPTTATNEVGVTGGFFRIVMQE